MLNSAELDKKLAGLQKSKGLWARFPLHLKIEKLERVLDNFYDLRHEWVRLCCEHKGIPLDSPLAGEEWMNGPVSLMRNIRLNIESLKRIAAEKDIPIKGSSIHQLDSGQIAVDVFPNSLLETVMFAGIQAQVRLQQGVTKDNLSKHVASRHKKPSDMTHRPGCVSLVLGAGNVSSIGPLDVLQKLNENKVVILKMNPVNDYLAPLIKQAFQPLTTYNFVHVVTGGADVGEYLCQNDKVEDIHITGSDKTHDIICYGLGEKGRKAKERNKPRLHKTITSELGNITPIIVVPGQWSESELRFHALNVATQLVNNAGFNCLAARVLVLHQQWPQREQFMRYLGEAFSQCAPRNAYYPGAYERYQKFIQAHPENVHTYCVETDAVIPWTIISDLSPDEESICYKEEAFCGVMAQTNVSAQSVEGFLRKASSFCNDKLWGTLSACVIASEQSQSQHKAAFDRFIDELHYGGVAINQWHALLYALGTTTWGAYPGHTWQDIQSGTGTVHNAWMLDKPEKSVMTGPFTTHALMPFMPPWFATNPAMDKIGSAMCDMEYQPSWLKLPTLVWAMMQGVWQHSVQKIYHWFGSSKPAPNSVTDVHMSDALSSSSHPLIVERLQQDSGEPHTPPSNQPTRRARLGS